MPNHYQYIIDVNGGETTIAMMMVISDNSRRRYNCDHNTPILDIGKLRWSGNNTRNLRDTYSLIELQNECDIHNQNRTDNKSTLVKTLITHYSVVHSRWRVSR